MLGSTAKMLKALSALAAVCAMAAAVAGPASAQKATNLVCDGCVQSKDIKDGGIKALDLAPGLVLGQTILVRADGSAAANCASLREALSKLKAKATSPALVKLEAGTYNCGSTPLAMKRFVAIEGAGPGGTRIVGNPNNDAVINGAANASLRQLAVVHQGTVTGQAVGISTGAGHMSLRDVAVRINSSSPLGVRGILAIGGALDLSDVSVETISTDGGGQGIDGRSGAKLTMMNVWINNSSVAGNPAALQLMDSNVTAHGVLFSSNGFGMLGFGDSTFQIRGGTIVGAVSSGGGSVSCVGVARIGGGGVFTQTAADCGV